MNCLQCGKPAIENGNEYESAKIRECEDHHRTAVYTKIRKKKSYKIISGNGAHKILEAA